jgi:hypothetical protein
MSNIDVNITYTGSDIGEFRTSWMLGDPTPRRDYQTKLQNKFNTVSGILAQHGFKIGDIVDHAKQMRGNMDENNLDALARDLKPLDFQAEKDEPFDMSVMFE